MADEAKAKGNAAFASGNFNEAISHFTTAINLSPTNHVLYSNRSAAYASIGNYTHALTDAQKTVDLKPDWPKGYSRLGSAHLGLNQFSDAVLAYKKGLEFDPNNEGLKSGLNDAESAISESKLSMKLLIDTTKAGRVLYAEADSNCVDFLLNILSLPVGTIIRLLNEEEMKYCSLPNIYKSIENLSNNYIQPNQNKDILLKPKCSVGISSVPFLLPNTNNVSPTERTFYKCSNTFCRYGSTYVTNDPTAKCPTCGYSMSKHLTYDAPQEVKATTGGFVKELVTYMVMDDLVVRPMSTISSITLLNKFNVKDVSALQEVVVNFGMEEALELLKASFESKGTVLTSVFMSRVKVEN